MEVTITMSDNPDVENIEQLERLCKVLLDEDRLMILGLLALAPRRADELAAQVPPRSSAATKLARHLQQLQLAGLARLGDDDRYCFESAQLHTLKRQLFTREAVTAGLSDDDKALTAFVKQGRLTHLPAQPAKLLMVLRWLAERIMPDRPYSEREVNDLLRGHEVDYATLRRLLVDHGLLARAAGVYTRKGEA